MFAADVASGSMQQILVLGASGFIGSYIADLLSKRTDLEVVCAGRTRKPGGFPSNASFRHIDLNDPRSFSTAVFGCATVINCARLPAGEQQNRAITTALVDECKAAGVRKIINFSSVAAFGSVAEHVDEATPSRPPINGYGRDKLVAEAVYASSADETLRVVSLRPTLVFGNGGEEWSEYFIRGIARGQITKLTLNGNGRANLIYVKDIAYFCETLLTREIPAYSMMIVDGGYDISFNDSFSKLSEIILGKRLKERHISKQRWDARRNVIRVSRALVKAGSPALAARISKHLFLVDEPFEKYAADISFDNALSKSFGFQSKYSVQSAIAEMAKTRALALG